MEATSCRRVYGIDFSGAKDAGKWIWLAGGIVDGAVLRIEECYQAKDLPGSSARRDECLAVLRDFIVGLGTGAVGLDFPFGLPRALVKQKSWEDFILAFPDEYPNAEAFQQACWEAADGRELKRVTDRQSETPFSPYNLRLFRQTYYGIRDLLHPLVRNQLACVLPMQCVQPDKSWVLEICPASTLKRESLYLQGYKQGEEGYTARARILEWIEAIGILSISSSTVRSAVLNDPHGDALDSVIAAFATMRAVSNPAGLSAERGSDYALEGFVFV